MSTYYIPAIYISDSKHVKSTMIFQAGITIQQKRKVIYTNNDTEMEYMSKLPLPPNTTECGGESKVY